MSSVMGLRLIALIALVAASAGCGGGQRLTILVTSDPPDALVTINNFPRGVTPLEVPYLWIGTYRVELERDGYETVDEMVKIRKPFYNWVPFSTLVLGTLPFPVPHERHLHYSLALDDSADL